MTMINAGLVLPRDNRGSAGLLANVQQAEARGIERVWSTVGGAFPDPVTGFAAAAATTERIGSVRPSPRPIPFTRSRWRRRYWRWKDWPLVVSASASARVTDPSLRIASVSRWCDRWRICASISPFCVVCCGRVPASSPVISLR